MYFIFILTIFAGIHFESHHIVCLQKKPVPGVVEAEFATGSAGQQQVGIAPAVFNTVHVRANLLQRRHSEFSPLTHGRRVFQQYSSKQEKWNSNNDI